MALTEKQIAKLESKGFKRWTKGEYDRLYINAYNIHGIDTNWKKNGKKTLSINGEELSYTKSANLSYMKIYIDVKTGEVVADWDSVKALVEAELNEVIEETTEKDEPETVENVTTEEKPKVVADVNDKVMESIKTLMTNHNYNMYKILGNHKDCIAVAIINKTYDGRGIGAFINKETGEIKNWQEMPQTKEQYEKLLNA